MNLNTIKIIFKKEFKDIVDLKHMKKMLLILLLIPAIILIMGSSQSDYFGVNSFSVFSISSGFFFYVFSSQSLQRKFFEVKAINGFQSLLVLPITIKEIWFGKILSIIITSYVFILIMNVLILIAGLIKLGTVVLATYNLENIMMMLVVSPMIVSVVIIISSWVALRFKDHRIIEYFNTALIVGLMLGFMAMPRFEYLFAGINMDFVAIIGLILAIIVDIIFYCLIGRIKKEML